MQPHGKNSNINQPELPELPGTKPSINKGVNVAPAAYVAELGESHRRKAVNIEGLIGDKGL